MEPLFIGVVSIGESLLYIFTRALDFPLFVTGPLGRRRGPGNLRFRFTDSWMGPKRLDPVGFRQGFPGLIAGG